MATIFNADEVFEMAEQIERNGAEFYRRAAESVDSEEARVHLSDLADAEVQHEKDFHAMREELSAKETEPVTFDPEGEAAAYLRAMADDRVFDYKSDVGKFFEGAVDVVDVFRKAVELEKDSIVFYQFIKELVPESFGRDKIDRIIAEEMKHITILRRAAAFAEQDLAGR